MLLHQLGKEGTFTERLLIQASETPTHYNNTHLRKTNKEKIKLHL